MLCTCLEFRRGHVQEKKLDLKSINETGMEPDKTGQRPYNTPGESSNIDDKKDSDVSPETVNLGFQDCTQYSK